MISRSEHEMPHYDEGDSSNVESRSYIVNPKHQKAIKLYQHESIDSLPRSDSKLITEPHVKHALQSSTELVGYLKESKPKLSNIHDESQLKNFNSDEEEEIGCIISTFEIEIVKNCDESVCMSNSQSRGVVTFPESLKSLVNITYERTPSSHVARRDEPYSGESKTNTKYKEKYQEKNSNGFSTQQSTYSMPNTIERRYYHRKSARNLNKTKGKVIELQHDKTTIVNMTSERHASPFVRNKTQDYYSNHDGMYIKRKGDQSSNKRNIFINRQHKTKIVESFTKKDKNHCLIDSLKKKENISNKGSNNHEARTDIDENTCKAITDYIVRLCEKNGYHKLENVEPTPMYVSVKGTVSKTARKKESCVSNKQSFDLVGEHEVKSKNANYAMHLYFDKNLTSITDIENKRKKKCKHRR